MRFNINARVSLHTQHPKKLLAVLEPENDTMKNGIVESESSDDSVVSQIRGTMEIGTLLHTIDDIIKTSILFDQVSDSAVEE